MTAVLVLVLCQAAMIGLVAIAVRQQYALLGGYDLTLAAVIAVAAESVVYATGFSGGAWGLLCALLIAWCVSTVGMYLWNIAMTGTAVRRDGGLVFVVSLGVNSAITGLIGLVRGPGTLASGVLVPRVHFAELEVAGILVIGIVLAAIATTLFVLWRRTSAGVGVALLEQDARFAQELGVEPARLCLPAAAAVGGVASAVGVYQGLANGASPEGGAAIAMYGIGAAFLVEGRGVLGAIIGGVVFAVILVGSQLFVSASMAPSILFAITLTLVLARGTSRMQQGVR